MELTKKEKLYLLKMVNKRMYILQNNNEGTVNELTRIYELQKKLK